jgi:hypothetical protein
MGNFIRAAVSYIHLASSQLSARCLSQNTGTTRPLDSNTFTISPNSRRLG